MKLTFICENCGDELEAYEKQETENIKATVTFYCRRCQGIYQTNKINRVVYIPIPKPDTDLTGL